MSGDLLLAVSPGEVWAARVERGQLVELRIAREGSNARVGTIFLGRIVALKPDLPAALVEIGEARPAFLSAEDAAPNLLAGLTEGKAVLVQVTKEARADKATGVSLRIRLGGALVDLVPGGKIDAARSLASDERFRLVAAVEQLAEPGEGFRIRAEAKGAQRSDLAADISSLRARWKAIEARRSARPPVALDPEAGPLPELLAALLQPPPQRIVIDDRAAYATVRGFLSRHRPALADALELYAGTEPLFEREGVAAQLAAALAPRVALAGGGALIIETTSAATLIDVDSGGAPAMATNFAAAREAARQIGIRNISGPIVVDFIGMKGKAERERVGAELRRALARDPAAPDLLGWTRLGHMELVRKRRHPALEEILFERGQDGGRVKTALTVALAALRDLACAARAEPARAFALRAAPEVVAALADGPARAARLELEARLGRALAVEPDPKLGRETFDISPA